MMSKLQPVIYINHGQVEAMGDGAHAHGNTSNQIVNAENSSVETQTQGDRNVAVDGDVNDGNIITGDKNNNEKHQSLLLCGVEQMANTEHLGRLWQGVEVWNQWRKDNPEIKIDLCGVDLRWADFIGVNLIGANLIGANLIGINFNKAKLNRANFSRANFSRAKLSGAKLNKANLKEAILCEADFSRANLRLADLIGANLKQAILRETDFSRANLSGADLNEANLKEAILRETDFSRANLSAANLSGANLSGADLRTAKLSAANLSGAKLNEANLLWANLDGANLSGASLQTVRLINAYLDGANLTGAYLWETQRAGWSIKGVICEYAYWDEKAKEKILYAPGEFERLFADQTKIRLSYKDGISLFEIGSLPTLIQHLEEMQGYSLRFVSITEGGGGTVVELAIEDTDEKTAEEIEAIKQAMEAEAERNIQILREILETKEGKIKKLKGKVEGLKETISDLWRDYKGETIMGDKYEISGQVGAVGKNARADHNTFNQLWNQSKDSIDLAKLAEELIQLRTALKEEAVEVEHDVAVSEVGQALIEAKAGNGSKVMGHLKAAGKWAFDTATKIGTSVAADMIKKSMEP